MHPLYRENVFIIEKTESRHNYECKNLCFYSNDSHAEDLLELFKLLCNNYDIYYKQIIYNEGFAPCDNMSLYHILERFLSSQLVVEMEKEISSHNTILRAKDINDVYKITIKELYGENNFSDLFLSMDLVSTGYYKNLFVGSLSMCISFEHLSSGVSEIDLLLRNFGKYSSRKKKEIIILEKML